MIFLKLGGSLITDKTGEESPRLEVIQRLANEISRARQQQPKMKLLIGHGSGSFGHRVAEQYDTHLGAKEPEDWHGFTHVAAAANRLHRILIDQLREENLPVISFPPSSMILSSDSQIRSYASDPIWRAMEHHLIPVIYGDVAFDESQGAAIISTEQLLAYLTAEHQPQRMLLAGKSPVIQAETGDPIPRLSNADLESINFHQIEGADVTGGMRAKVEQALILAKRYPAMEVLIFAAEIPGILHDVLLGAKAGTQIQSN